MSCIVFLECFVLSVFYLVSCLKLDLGMVLGGYMDGFVVCGLKRDNKFSFLLVCWKGMLYIIVDDNDISRKSWVKGICIDVYSSNNDEMNE